MERAIFNFKENELLIAIVSSGISSSSVKKIVHLPLEINMSEVNFYNNSKNITAVKDALRSLRFKGKKAEFILSFDGIITRSIETPCLNKRDLQDFIDNNMSEYFTVNTEEFYFDYKILSTVKKEKKLYNILLAAVPRQKADDAAALIRACGLNPNKGGIYPDSIYKLFGAGIDSSICIFDANGLRSNIIILDKGEIFLYSNIQAEAYEDFEELIDNLGYFLNFYSTRHFGNRVDKLFCIGELSQNEKFIETLERQFAIDASGSVNPPGVTLSPSVREAPCGLMDIFGYLIKTNNILNKEMNFTNTLKLRPQKTAALKSNAVSILAIAAALATILFISGSLLFVFLENRIYDTSKINSELQGYKNTEEKLDSLSSARQTFDEKNSFLNYVNNDSFDYYSVLQTIKNGLPADISINSLTVNRSTVTAVFNIKSSTLDIARLNIALNSMKIFDHEEILNTALDDTSKTCTVNLYIKNTKK